MTPERTLPGVGGPEFIRLQHYGRLLHDAFGAHPYLVGTAAAGKTWRDVDVRLIVPDDQFAAMFPGARQPWWTHQYWSLLSVALSTLGQQYTGLPIDFQIQPASHANERYGGEPRVVLGLHLQLGR